MMNLFFMILCFGLLIGSIANLKLRLINPVFSFENKKNIKLGLIRTGIIGGITFICSVIVWWAFYDASTYIDESLFLFIMFIYIFGFIGFIVSWVKNPTVYMVNYEKDTNKIEEELKTYNFDKNMRYGITGIFIDNTKKEIIVKNFIDPSYYTLPFSSIIECEILEDDATIAKGGIGRAVIGGVLAGGIGAIVGAGTRKSKNVVNSLKIRITTKDIINAMRIINIITEQTNKSDSSYVLAENYANELYSTITSIISNESNQDNGEISTDPYLELEKLSELFKKGIITENEFSSKKTELLKKI